MKLFMRNFYDQPDKRQEIKDPMNYSVICVGCAGLLGGKMLESRQATWHVGECACCGEKKSVTQPRNYIWRT